MDKSETYIKMCDWAEIQELAPKKRYSCDLYSQNGFIGAYDQYRPEESNYEAIWLPRQDKLQEMSGLLWIDFDNMCRGYWFGDFRRETTKEQAGIRVVMKEKYGKVWEGDKWL